MARNRYADLCFRCGGLVLPGEGHFQKVTSIDRKKWPALSRNAKWQTQHDHCAITWRASKRHYIHAPDAPPAEK